MGRSRAQPPVPTTIISECFACRQDGKIVRRDHRLAALAHEPAGYRGADGKLMVGVAYQGRIRRIALLRIAHVLAFAEWPNGHVMPVDGDQWNGAPSNLRVIRRGRNPFATGKSSLQRRQAVDVALLMALAGHSDASVARLGAIIGLSESGACTRLTKLERKGLAISPQCVPGRSWMLSQRGRQLAQTSNPVILDDLDKDILMACARAAHGLMALVRVTGSCRLTVRRRIDALIERGLAVESGGRFAATDAGLTALGPSVPQRWVDSERIQASTARDVVCRQHGLRYDGEAEAAPAQRGRPSGSNKWERAVVAA